jgi:hypothetical protein
MPTRPEFCRKINCSSFEGHICVMDEWVKRGWKSPKGKRGMRQLLAHDAEHNPEDLRRQCIDRVPGEN